MKSSLTSSPQYILQTSFVFALIALQFICLTSFIFAEFIAASNLTSNTILTPEYVLELALSSPVFLNESSA